MTLGITGDSNAAESKNSVTLAMPFAGVRVSKLASLTSGENNNHKSGKQLCAMYLATTAPVGFPDTGGLILFSADGADASDPWRDPVSGIATPT